MNIQALLGSTVAAAIVALGTATTALAFAPYSAMINGQDYGSRVNLRSGPSTQTNPIGHTLVGEYVTVTAHADSADGYTWFYITAASGKQGWVRGDLIAPDMRRFVGR